MSDDFSSGLAPTAIEARSMLAQYLQPHIFPATVEALVASADAEHAPASAIEALKGLPPGSYRTTSEVWVALGGPTEELFTPPEAAPAQARSESTPWADQVAERAGALVTHTVARVLRLPHELGWRLAAIVRRN